MLGKREFEHLHTHIHTGIILWFVLCPVLIMDFVGDAGDKARDVQVLSLFEIHSHNTHAIVHGHTHGHARFLVYRHIQTYKHTLIYSMGYELRHSPAPQIFYTDTCYQFVMTSVHLTRIS